MSLQRKMIRVPKDELDFLKNESINVSDVARKAIHDKCIKLGIEGQPAKVNPSNPLNSTQGAEST